MTNVNGRAVLVTGAGAGLGRAHALLLGARGARVAVNDLDRDAAQAVVDDIQSAGGQAIAVAGSVTDMNAVLAMVSRTHAAFGRLDGLVANAGILRDKTLAKMDLEDFRLVMEVHVMGAVHCVKAAWPLMVSQGFGRIVLTTSSSGLYGNFGQSNYGAAKMALVGLMQTLGLEGARHDIRVNCLAPTAATQMLDGLLPEAELDRLRPEHVSPGVLALLSDTAPNRTVLCAGAGAFATANITLTPGAFVGTGEEAPETLAAKWEDITRRDGETLPPSGAAQGAQELAHSGLIRAAG